MGLVLITTTPPHQHNKAMLTLQACIKLTEIDSLNACIHSRYRLQQRQSRFQQYELIDSSFSHFGPPANHLATAREGHDQSGHQFLPLTPAEITEVEKFVLFIGYPGSGHSVIGSLMDAHPQMIISHEFSVLLRISRDSHLSDKATLFNAIYKDSYNDLVRGWRASDNVKKGYSLGTKSKWQAKFTNLTVIGDKSGGRTTRFYHQYPDKFDHSYHQLMKTIGVPVCVFHVVRNPYDMAATSMLYQLSHKLHGVKYSGANVTHRYNDTTKLRRHVRAVAARAGVNAELMQKYHLNTLEVHNSEFVLEPRATCEKICQFLGVVCPDLFLQECRDKAFPEVSKTRSTVVWSEDLIADVQELISRYHFFKNYSFDSN